MAIAIVINWLYALNFAHFDQNEGNGTSLVLEAHVHSLSEQSFADRSFHFFVPLDQPFELHLLLSHLVHFANFLLNALIFLEKIGLLCADLAHQFGFVRVQVCFHGKIAIFFFLQLAVGRRFVPSLHPVLLFESLKVNHFFELFGEVVIKVEIQRDLFPILREDVASEEHIQGVINSSAQILDAFAVHLFLLPHFFLLVIYFHSIRCDHTAKSSTTTDAQLLLF